jgi:hypothetical protein
LRSWIVVIVLLLAAFAGGIAASGSRPGWLQAALKMLPRGGPGLESIPSTILPPTQDGDAVTSVGSIPSAPLPPLVVGPVPEDPAQSSVASQGPKSSPAALAPELAPPSEAAPVLEGSAAPDSLAMPPARGLAKTDSSVAQAQLVQGESSRPAPASAPRAPGGPSGPPPGSATKDQGWGDAPGSAPASAALPQTPGASAKALPAPPGALAISAPLPEATPAVGGELAPQRAQAWAEIRRRMRELGVTRYWLEGETDGPVRFRCVIPLVGQRAVGQQFEAEGDDDLQAADAALRRVALWRATETP